MDSQSASRSPSDRSGQMGQGNPAEVRAGVPYDSVNHPRHYTSSPARCEACGSGIECIEITRHMGFNLGNALKYIWRADLKGSTIEDLEKAAWYINDEIQKRRSEGERKQDQVEEAAWFVKDAGAKRTLQEVERLRSQGIAAEVEETQRCTAINYDSKARCVLFSGHILPHRWTQSEQPPGIKQHPEACPAMSERVK